MREDIFIITKRFLRQPIIFAGARFPGPSVCKISPLVLAMSSSIWKSCCDYQRQPIISLVGTNFLLTSPFLTICSHLLAIWLSYSLATSSFSSYWVDVVALSFLECLICSLADYVTCAITFKSSLDEMFICGWCICTLGGCKHDIIGPAGSSPQ